MTDGKRRQVAYPRRGSQDVWSEQAKRFRGDKARRAYSSKEPAGLPPVIHAGRNQVDRLPVPPRRVERMRAEDETMREKAVSWMSAIGLVLFLFSLYYLVGILAMRWYGC